MIFSVLQIKVYKTGTTLCFKARVPAQDYHLIEFINIHKTEINMVQELNYYLSCPQLLEAKTLSVLNKLIEA